MSAETNKAAARRFIAEVWNRGDLAVVDELVSSTYVYKYSVNAARAVEDRTMQ